MIRFLRNRRAKNARHSFAMPAPLEPRQMLAGDVGSEISPILIRAAGDTGQETLELRIDGNAVARWENVGGNYDQRVFQTFRYDGPEVAGSSIVEVAFVNDLYDPGVVDRNLHIDDISLNGVTLQSEASGVFSTGTWSAETGIEPRFAESETLHANGSFRFDIPIAQPSQVTIFAAGQTGEETLQLLIDNAVAAEWNNVGGDFASRQFESYTYQATERLTADRVRIAFSNDQFVPGVLDRNLFVDKVVINNVDFESEAESTWSTGTWNPINRAAVPGRVGTEVLTNNGFFAYFDTSALPAIGGPGSSVLTVRAKGDTALESFDLFVDRQSLGRFEVTAAFTDYEVVVPGAIQADQVRIEYNTDDRGAAQGVDANLTVDWIQIDGERFETEESSTYSSGTGFIGEDVQFGFGHGDSLYVNGFFQYQALVLRDDLFSIPEDATDVPLAVMANDSIADGYTAQLMVDTSPQFGQVEFVDGVLLYTPNSEFAGVDSFTYQVASNNGSRQLDPVRVEINVRESHQQPQTLINPRVAPELTPSGKTLQLQRLVQLPPGENGRQPRMNAMATWGDRIFVVTDGSVDGEGKIYELVKHPSGATTVELFFDVGAAVFANSGLNIDNSTPLNGLRSVAFHPDFDSNGKFYTTFTGQRPDDLTGLTYLSDPANPIDVEGVLVEWTYELTSDQVDLNSYREVFRVGMLVNDHPIRGLAFNPFASVGDEDYGLLYIGHGDASEQSAVSGDGQNNDALGKILRIDPLADGDRPYTTPESNPFVDRSDMIDEAYAIGFRNPHNLSFARDASGQTRLVVTEIGRDNVEEINIVEKGGNYGWANREGIFVHDRNGFAVNGNISNLPDDEADNGYIYPVAIWGHDGEPGQSFVGQAITGSHVIQNGSVELDGQFIFAEFATDGRAYHIDFEAALTQTTTLDPTDPARDQPSDLTWLTPQELTILFDHDNDPSTTALVRDSIKDVLDDEPDFEQVPSAGTIRADLRLGQGPGGELYVINKRNGWVYLATNTIA